MAPLLASRASEEAATFDQSSEVDARKLIRASKEHESFDLFSPLSLESLLLTDTSSVPGLPKATGSSYKVTDKVAQ
jgi:hypothetical protein